LRCARVILLRASEAVFGRQREAAGGRCGRYFVWFLRPLPSTTSFDHVL
jgi:hypothetical protein